MNALAVIASSMTRTYPVPGHRRSGVNALDVVDLALPHASFTALVGASGCGKSTLLQCVAGLDRPTSGSVRVLGTETTALRPAAAARFRADHIGFVFQEDNLVTALSARDNVALPGRLRRRPLSRADVDAALERVGLSRQARHLPLPKYRIEEQVGGVKDSRFVVSCDLGELGFICRAQGTNRKAAEQEAAAEALIWLERQLPFKKNKK